MQKSDQSSIRRRCGARKGGLVPSQLMGEFRNDEGQVATNTEFYGSEPVACAACEAYVLTSKLNQRKGQYGCGFEWAG
jgi:hypothetical protein